MFNSDIAKQALIANLSVGVWSARKTDKAVLKEISTIYKSEEEQGSFSKLLIAKARLNEIREIASSARKLHNDLTLPWIDGGGRLLPAKDYPEYEKKMTQYSIDFFEAVEKLLDTYQEAVDEGTAKLGEIANVRDYPSKEAVREKYAFDFTFFPIPDNGDFRVTLSPDFITSIKSNFDQNHLDRFKKAKKFVVDDIIALVSNAISRLRIKDKSSWFKSATIENLVTYREDHAMIELLDDQPLFDMLADISRIANTYTVGALRLDDNLKDIVADSFIEVLVNASKNISLITTPIDILTNPDIMTNQINDIDIDIDQAVSNMKDVLVDQTNSTVQDISQPDPQPELEGVMDLNVVQAVMHTAEEAVNDIRDGEIFNPFGMKFGEQPKVNSDDLLFRKFETEYEPTLFVPKEIPKQVYQDIDETPILHQTILNRRFNL